MDAQRPLLLFDSGVGGLSVLDAIRRLLPTAPIVYVADSGGFPYGTKSESEIAARVPYPVVLQNDATSACAAELVFGRGPQYPDFLYLFIGSFIGGGVVLNHHLYPGRSRYAGAIGPMPIPVRGGTGHQQLLRSASLYVLGERLAAAGGDPSVLTRDPDNWGDIGAPLDAWVAETAADLALTITAAVSIIDFEAVVIDGAFPVTLRRRLVEATRAALGGFDMQGVAPFSVVEGSIGSGAREIGGACLPLLANFTKDREVLFKE